MKKHFSLSKTDIVILIDELESENHLIIPKGLTRKQERQLRANKHKKILKEKSISSENTKHSKSDNTKTTTNKEIQNNLIYFYSNNYHCKRSFKKYNEKDLKIRERIPNAKLIEVKIDNDEETEDEQILYGQEKMEQFITETMKKIKDNKKYIDKNISRKFNKPIYIPDDFVIIIEDEEEEEE